MAARVAITPYTLMQAIAAEGDVTTPVVVKPSDGEGTVISTTSEPEYYFVVVLAGQSNSMSFGEGLPLPETYDRPDPRIKQLARRSTVTPGGAACKYNDIIPADHCLHDVQDMSNLNHPHADLSKGTVRLCGACSACCQKAAAVYACECGYPSCSMWPWRFGIYCGGRGGV